MAMVVGSMMDRDSSPVGRGSRRDEADSPPFTLVSTDCVWDMNIGLGRGSSGIRVWGGDTIADGGVRRDNSWG